MSKNRIIAVLGTAVILVLVLVVSNFNIQVNINNKENKASSQQTAKTTQQEQADSMADHHGGGASVDATVFNGLINKSAPDFILESYDGKKVILSELKGQNVVLFFNEGLMCYPACWNQVAAFGKDTNLSGKAVILNITVDSSKTWKQAVDKMPEIASATVLFDPGRVVSQKYGVLTLPSSMHKGQYPGHTYVLIDKEGIVRYVKDDVSMAVRNIELAAELDKF